MEAADFLKGETKGSGKPVKAKKKGMGELRNLISSVNCDGR